MYVSRLISRTDERILTILFFFVGNLRTPINTWATFLPKYGKEKVKKGQKQVKNGIFSCFFARFRLYLEDFVAEGDEISDSTPVHYERHFVVRKHT